MRVNGVEIGNDDLCVLERGERGLLPQNRWVPDGLDVSRGRRMGFGLGGSDRVAGVGACMCVRDVGWRRFLGPGVRSSRVGSVW